MERLAGDLLQALIGRQPELVRQTADACLEWSGRAQDGDERNEVLAAVAASASSRYARGGGGVLPVELTLLAHFSARE